MDSMKMSVFHDDGIALDLSVVFILFLMPNFMFILLTSFNISLICISKKHPQLKRLLGKISNFFAKGALDRVTRNMLRHFEKRKRQRDEQISMARQESSYPSKRPRIPKDAPNVDQKYDANYILLIPFQIDLLLTVFIYKILTRDVYPETCQSFLTTYANREKQVVCWLRHLNRNNTNLSFNISLVQYCTNQTITYINSEHNDVICIKYVFKLINIIDTVTNIFAWHQAIVFMVTKSIIISSRFQQKLWKTATPSNLFDRSRCIVLFSIIILVSSIYMIVFVFVFPIYFASTAQTRIDLTRHLLYACSKFLVGILVYVNLYTLYQWYSHTIQKTQLLPQKPTEPSVSLKNNNLGDSIIIMDDYLGTSSTKHLTPNDPV